MSERRAASEVTFDRVASLVADWRPTDDGSPPGRRLQRYLDARLNDPDAAPWQRDVVEYRRRSDGGEVVVNGEIVVPVVFDVRPAVVSALKRRLDRLASRHNYLLVYWWESSGESADSRRTVERTLTARRLGVDGVAFVRRRTPVSTPARRSADVSYAGPVAATAAAVALAALFAAGLSTAQGLPSLARAFLLLTGSLFVGALVTGGLVCRR